METDDGAAVIAEASRGGDALRSATVPLGSLSAADTQAMWRLYSEYYGGTSEALFRADLAGKTDVVLARDPAGEIRGFTTVEVCRTDHLGSAVTVLFSGDTVVDHRYWARNDIAAEWIRFAGVVAARFPGEPLYWLLIVKGYRTYRYLSVFGREYFPSHRAPTPPEVQRLIDHLAGSRFGDAYDPPSGLVRFAESKGHLQPRWAGVPERALARPEVAFFLERNPGYARGDELVCLCEVSEANMKRLTLRLFEEGRSAGGLGPAGTGAGRPR